MGSKQVNLDEEAQDILNNIRQSLTPPENWSQERKRVSYSRAIKLLASMAGDIDSKIRENFDHLHQLLLIKYQGSPKAHLSYQLQSLLVQSNLSDEKYKSITEEINKILMNGRR